MFRPLIQSLYKRTYDECDAKLSQIRISRTRYWITSHPSRKNIALMSIAFRLRCYSVVQLQAFEASSLSSDYKDSSCVHSDTGVRVGCFFKGADVMRFRDIAALLVILL